MCVCLTFSCAVRLTPTCFIPALRYIQKLYLLISMNDLWLIISDATVLLQLHYKYDYEYKPAACLTMFQRLPSTCTYSVKTFQICSLDYFRRCWTDCTPKAFWGAFCIKACKKRCFPEKKQHLTDLPKITGKMTVVSYDSVESEVIEQMEVVRVRQ